MSLVNYKLLFALSLVIAFEPTLACAQTTDLKSTDQANATGKSIVLSLVPTSETRLGFAKVSKWLAFNAHQVWRVEDRDAKLVWSAPIEIADVKITAAALVDDAFLVVGHNSRDLGQLRFYGESNQLLWRQEFENPITCVTALADSFCVGDLSGRIIRVRADDGSLLWQKLTHSKTVTTIARFNDDLAVSGDWTGKLSLWTSVDGVEQAEFRQHRDGVTSLLVPVQKLAGQDLSDNSQPQSLVSASRDGTVRLWYPLQKRLVRFAQLDAPVTSLCLFEEGKVLAGCNDGSLHVIDCGNAKVTHSLTTGLPYVGQLQKLAGRFWLADCETLSKEIQIPPGND